MNLDSVVSALVPSGKLLAWIIATGAALFMAGVGATLQFGDVAASIETIPKIRADVTSNTVMIEQLLDSVSSASDERAQILCAVIISVSGEELTAPEVIGRCP